MHDRVIDNAKVLKATGMEQRDLMPIGEGLARELSGYLASCPRASFAGPGANARFDGIVVGVPSLLPIARGEGAAAAVRYLVRRVLG